MEKIRSPGNFLLVRCTNSMEKIGSPGNFLLVLCTNEASWKKNRNKKKATWRAEMSVWFAGSSSYRAYIGIVLYFHSRGGSKFMKESCLFVYFNRLRLFNCSFALTHSRDCKANNLWLRLSLKYCWFCVTQKPNAKILKMTFLRM